MFWPVIEWNIPRQESQIEYREKEDGVRRSHKPQTS